MSIDFRANPWLSLGQGNKCVNSQPVLFESYKHQLQMAPNVIDHRHRGSSTRPTNSLLRREWWTVLAIGGQDGLVLWISSRVRTCNDPELFFMHV